MEKQYKESDTCSTKRKENRGRKAVLGETTSKKLIDTMDLYMVINA